MENNQQSPLSRSVEKMLEKIDKYREKENKAMLDIAYIVKRSIPENAKKDELLQAFKENGFKVYESDTLKKENKVNAVKDVSPKCLILCGLHEINILFEFDEQKKISFLQAHYYYTFL